MQYDVGSATVTVSIFFAIFCSGKACIYAFLAVYFRHLGISPFQAGVLRGVQALIGGLSIPIIVYCTGLCAHRRFMMIACIFLTMASYLALLVMSLPSYSCFVSIPSTCDNFSFVHLNSSTNASMQIKRSTLSSNFISSFTIQTQYPFNNQMKNASNVFSTKEISSSSPLPNWTQEAVISNTEIPTTIFSQVSPKLHEKKQLHSQPIAPEWHLNPPLSNLQMKNYNNWIYRPQRSIKEKPETTDPSTKPIPLSVYQRIWPNLNASCFIMLVVILIVGEMVSSPIDNIASNTWFIYLDEIDNTETHRKHLTYIPMTTAIVICIIGIINMLQCLTVGEPFKAYHINFYIFGSLLGIALVTTYFFPIPQRKNTSVYFYGQGLDMLRYFCSSSASTLLLTTVVVNGILYACVHDYLLWFIEDLGGSQFATCQAVALAYFSDAIVKFLGKRMQKRISANGLVILGVAFYGIRFLLFTAIVSPWGIVFTQAVHCFSSCLFWKGIIVQVRKCYDTKAEQQILLVLHTFHYILGYCVGSVVSGFLYNSYKPSVLFWAMAGLSFTWSSVLFLCFFAFDIKLQKKEIILDSSMDSEQMSLFSVSSDHEED